MNHFWENYSSITVYLWTCHYALYLPAKTHVITNLINFSGC